MNLKTIAKIQLRIGILLLIVAVIGGVWVIQNIYIEGTLLRGDAGITSQWTKVSQETDGTSIGIAGHVVSDIILLASIVKTTMYLFGACAFIVAVLGVMLILEGLANLKK